MTPCETYGLPYRETLVVGRELMKAIELSFSLGFTGLYHDEAGGTSTSYTYHLWDNVTAILDPTTKKIVATPGAIPLLRLVRSERAILPIHIYTQLCCAVAFFRHVW